MGGFEEVQIAPDAWRVSFTGNGYTSEDRVQDFVLLRSAELATLNGFSYFGFAAASSRMNSLGTYTMPATATTTGSAYVVGNTIYGNTTTTSYGATSFALGYPSANSTVVMFKEKPATQGMVYDARFICRSLGAKHKVQCKDG